MGRMLNLLETLIDKAHQYREFGRSHVALPILRRLASQPNLCPTEAGEIHQLLGQIYLDTRQFRLARKVITRAIRVQPDDAKNYQLMAHAIESDPEIDARRAGRYYRNALELAPDDAEILADAGFFAVQMGQSRKGLAQIRRALSLAQDNLDIVRTLIEALCEAGHVAEAERELQLARFRHARDPRFRAIVGEFEFRRARRQQRQFASLSESNNRAVLPFLRLKSGGREVGMPRIVRHDAATASRPHFPRISRHADSKQTS